MKVAQHYFPYISGLGLARELKIILHSRWNEARPYVWVNILNWGTFRDFFSDFFICYCIVLNIGGAKIWRKVKSFKLAVSSLGTTWYNRKN